MTIIIIIQQCLRLGQASSTTWSMAHTVNNSSLLQPSRRAVPENFPAVGVMGLGCKVKFSSTIVLKLGQGCSKYCPIYIAIVIPGNNYRCLPVKHTERYMSAKRYWWTKNQIDIGMYYTTLYIHYIYRSKPFAQNRQKTRGVPADEGQYTKYRKIGNSTHHADPPFPLHHTQTAHISGKMICMICMI